MKIENRLTELAEYNKSTAIQIVLVGPIVFYMRK